MKLVSLLAAGLIALTAAPAAAYLVKANVECPKVIEEDANEVFRLQNNWWVLGYISAMNRANDTSRGEGVDTDAIYAMLIDFCLANPDKDIDDASWDIYSNLR